MTPRTPTAPTFPWTEHPAIPHTPHGPASGLCHPPSQHSQTPPLVLPSPCFGPTTPLAVSGSSARPVSGTGFRHPGTGPHQHPLPLLMPSPSAPYGPGPSTPTHMRMVGPSVQPFERIMSPMSPMRGVATHDPRFRRRGRQPTACTECNRRKQRCDGLQPCHHCAKRNVNELCRFPDQKTPKPRPRGYSTASDGDTSMAGTMRPTRAFSGGTSARMDGMDSGSPGSDDSTSSGSENPFSKRKSSNESQTDARSPKRAAPSSYFTHPGHHARPGELTLVTHSSPVAMHSPPQSDGSTLVVTRSGPPSVRPPNTRRPSLQDLVHHSIPVSSERHSAQTPPPSWHEPPTSTTRATSRPPHFGPRGTRTPDSWGSHHEEGVFMQENGALGYGSLAVEGSGSGDDSGNQFQFYGTSHFGPRAAAEFFQEMSGSRKESLAVSDMHYRSSATVNELDSPFSLASHIRALDSRLPPRSLCERYVDTFFTLANSWMDILYEPDFRVNYARFWAIKGEFEDMTRIDVRWFALFQTVLAFGALLERSPSPSDGGGSGRDPTSLSNQFFVGARSALSEAPSFGGESIDTVRAYSLLSHYLVITRRVPEAWNMLGSAVRASEAQGFHIDGEKWKDLPPQEAELRRRLWAQMYCLDRSISYFLGRPLAIHDDKFSVVPPANILDSELSAIPRPNWPLTTPTKSTFLILHYRLAQIIGRILTTCFGLRPRQHADVMECEYAMVEWVRALPPVFNTEDPDLSWDEHYPWLRLQRQTLVSKFHQARIALHRPYLLHGGYTESRIACVNSAAAELRNRLHLLEEDTEALDRFKWMTVASGFAPACILGLLLARNRREDRVYDYDEIRSLFIAYIAAERRVSRDHSSDCEMQVLDMMLSKADAMRDAVWGRYHTSPLNSSHSNQGNPLSTQFPGPGDTPGASHGIIPGRAVGGIGGLTAGGRAGRGRMGSAAIIIPPEHMLTIPPPPRAMSVHELTVPSPAGQAAQLGQGQLQQHVANGSVTLAPPAEEWLAGRAWEPRPPYDPSAAAFPAADDMQSWNTLLNFIGTPAEAQPWYESDAVVIEE